MHGQEVRAGAPCPPLPSMVWFAAGGYDRTVEVRVCAAVYAMVDRARAL